MQIALPSARQGIHAPDTSFLIYSKKLQTIASSEKSRLALNDTLQVETIPVELADRSYDILVGKNQAPNFGKFLRSKGIRGDVMVFTSPRIGKLYFNQLSQSLQEGGFDRVVRHNIPDGEENKNWKQYNNCLVALMKSFPESGAVPTIINLGGGVVGDIGGFAAATFRRGVPYIQVPTTLLGDVDCGVGGKVGVNFKNVKNIIGTYYQPILVFSDLAYLDTLSAREIRSGTAEVIKYGAVCSDRLFKYLEQNIEKLISLDTVVLNHVVKTCYHIKADVVKKDEEDNKGVRIVLNFGHTVGHALEMAANYKLTHGEAISVGMIAATRIALKLGKCDEDAYKRLRTLIKRAGLPTFISPKLKINVKGLLETMRRDKKAVGGKNRFVLPTKIGDWCKQDNISESLITEVVESCFADKE